MKLQSIEKRIREEEIQKKEYSKPKKNAVIAVGQGKGIKNILNKLGVDIIIDGGQSMNPSTNDFLDAINSLKSTEIIILPNNKNIISAARQAASISEKNIEVIETRTIPEAIATMLIYNEDEELSILKQNMEKEKVSVKTGEITKAVKDSKVNGLTIKAGDIIALYNGNIELVGHDYKRVVIELCQKMINDEELISIYFGKDIKEEEAIELKELLMNEFDFVDVEIYSGGQPLYPYIISIE
jgi:uncharacterized protein